MNILEPTEYDILCGKDKTFSKHKGNQIFRAKIMSMTAEYRRASSKPERMRLTRIIVDSLRNDYRSRFLRSIKDSRTGIDKWEEINDQQARDKTSHALRFALNKEETMKEAPVINIEKELSRKAPSKRTYRRRSFSGVQTKNPPTSLLLTTTFVVDTSNSTTTKHTVRGVGTELSCESPKSIKSSSELGRKTKLMQQLHDEKSKLSFRRSKHRRIGSDLSSSEGETIQTTTDSDAGIHSSPARLGGGGDQADKVCGVASANVIEFGSFDIDGYHKKSPWNIDQLDMTVRSDDLNDFLDEEITCDWNSHTEEEEDDEEDEEQNQQIKQNETQQRNDNLEQDYENYRGIEEYYGQVDL